MRGGEDVSVGLFLSRRRGFLFEGGLLGEVFWAEGVEGVLTRRSVGRRGPGALVGRVDVEDLDPARGPVVHEEVLRGA